MIEDQSNPFLPTRWEHHGSEFPLIWFSETAKKITGNKPTFIAGTRGSGKTTLLKSICWEDLIHNPSLKAQRTITDLEYIGIYIKFPEHISSSIGTNDWSNIFPEIQSSDAEANSFFSLLVECICLEKALTAISSLRSLEKLSIAAFDEIELCESITKEYSNLTFFSDTSPSSFDQLARLMRNLIRKMNEASRRGNLEHLMSILPSREPLEILRYVITFLNKHCELVGSHKRIKPAFKFCLDDSEVLNTQQRMTINSMVRNSRYPITWVVCSVGDAVASTDTYLPNQKMAEADRKIIILNQRDNKEFQTLCEVVANMRLLMAKFPAESAFSRLENDNFKELSLERKFGKTVVNHMIHGMVIRSKKQEATTIIEGAKFLQTLMKKKPRSKKKINQALPYAQAYLLMLWQGREESFSNTIDAKQIHTLKSKASKLNDGAFNAWLRRKYVAALLHIADLLETKNINYSGIDVLISMSDGSIRDFLEIMAEVYGLNAINLNTSKPNLTTNDIINDFQTSSKTLTRGLQSKAFRAASKSFFKGAGLVTTSEPGAMVNLITFLGKYTSKLQSNSKSIAALRYCERGIFTIELNHQAELFSGEEKIEELLELLWQAELSGYIRRVDQPKTNLISTTSMEHSIGPRTFRLHKRLSSECLFSYRGAYEGVRIDSHQLWNAVNNPSKESEFLSILDKIAANEQLSGVQIPMDFEQ